MLLAFFILNYNYLNQMLSVEQTSAKEQTALCGIVDAYNRRNVKKIVRQCNFLVSTKERLDEIYLGLL